MADSKAKSMFLMKTPSVKIREPAEIQITAEQILFDAQCHQQQTLKLPKQNIQGPEELESYKLSKRDEFEEAIRRRKHHMGNWIKYANWEERLQEFRRCRSVYERAI